MERNARRGRLQKSWPALQGQNRHYGLMVQPKKLSRQLITSHHHQQRMCPVNNDLVVKSIENDLVVSTLDMWKPLDVDHNAILKLVKKYEQDFQEIRTFGFEIQKSAGRPTTFCYLNEEQATFLITLMKNSPRVVPFKKKLTREFYRMKKFIAQQMNQKANAEWLENRANGKLIRKIETDTLKRFVEYATAQGSKNAHHYYSNISSMQNKALFFIDQKFKNVRDLLDIHQLTTLQIADRIVIRALEEGMAANLGYKEIYQKAKQNIETFAAIHGKSQVPVAGLPDNRQMQISMA